MSEITPEKVARTVSMAVDSGWRPRLQAALSVTAEGGVLSLSVTRWEDDEEGTERVRHFWAPVVEGEKAPIVFDRATFEQRVNERFDEAVRKLGGESLAFMPATIAALRAQILALDVDLVEAAQADQNGGAA